MAFVGANQCEGMEVVDRSAFVLYYDVRTPSGVMMIPQVCRTLCCLYSTRYCMIQYEMCQKRSRSLNQAPLPQSPEPIPQLSAALPQQSMCDLFDRCGAYPAMYVVS